MKVEVVAYRRQYPQGTQEVVELSLLRKADFRGIAFFRRYFPLGSNPSTQAVLDAVNAENEAFYKDANPLQYCCVEERVR